MLECGWHGNLGPEQLQSRPDVKKIAQIVFADMESYCVVVWQPKRTILQLAIAFLRQLLSLLP